jgi:hypothetical protein
LIHKIGGGGRKSITTYKVHQFHQNNFSASDVGHVGQNMLWKTGQSEKIKN